MVLVKVEDRKEEVCNSFH